MLKEKIIATWLICKIGEDALKRIFLGKKKLYNVLPGLPRRLCMDPATWHTNGISTPAVGTSAAVSVSTK